VTSALTDLSSVGGNCDADRMRLWAACAAVATASLVTSLAMAQAPTPAPARPASRGEYIVHSVAMCIQCHSPRGRDGEIIEERKLTGAPIPVTGPFWNRDWAVRAPAIAGLPGFTDEQVIMLLTEGHAGDRPPPRRPMPPFRMTPEDARAVVAYLRSVK
jgi:mono/diheme cytochrome c family protein